MEITVIVDKYNIKENILLTKYFCFKNIAYQKTIDIKNKKIIYLFYTDRKNIIDDLKSFKEVYILNEEEN